jgi:hypothetical protein
MEKKKENKIVFDSINLFNRTETSQVNIEETWGREKWIGYGKKNDLPQELIRLYQNCDGLHSALIKRKTDMIAGNGFIDNPALNDFFKNQYSKEDLQKVAYKLAYDIVVFGGYYLNVVWDANGKKIARIEHMPFEKVRIAKPEDDIKCDIEGFYLSRDWTKWRKEENTPKYITAFDKDDEEKRIEQPSQLLYVRVYAPGNDYYALPTYISITNYLKLSYEISAFHLKSVQNGYMPGLIVTIPHVPPAEERERMSADIKLRSGADEAGKTVVVYGESPDKLPTFTVMNPVTSDEKFKSLMVQLNENIYVGHNANNVIAGVAVSGKLANTSEVKEQFSIFQTTVIQPLQNNIEATFNELAEINGLPKEIKFKEYTAVVDEIPAATVNETPNKL